MPLTIDQIINEAILLPNDTKAILVEKLVESIENNIDSNIEAIHITEAKRRRDEIRSGEVKYISGEEALSKVRKIVEK